MLASVLLLCCITNLAYISLKMPSFLYQVELAAKWCLKTLSKSEHESWASAQFRKPKSTNASHGIASKLVPKMLPMLQKTFLW